MASKLSSRLASRLASHILHSPKSHHPLISLVHKSQPGQPIYTLHSFSTLSRPARSHRSARPDIAAKARQLQTRRLWTYAITFSCIAGFIVIVLNQFQDQLVFYLTPTDALLKHSQNPTKSKFRLGGLVLENSLTSIPNSPEMEFVITDLITDILVKYDGSLPDLFREGHSVVVEGFIKPFTEEMREKERGVLSERKLEVTGKARSGDCYFAASEVLAKHDEKYMPAEVAAALEKNKKLLREMEGNVDEGDGAATARA
ncbi:cytochrome c-type biogenesis protein CcmE homolog, mitochondrial-like [Lycium barbarum]|uniref:cytochrome c-type biogenesis protein CcmE homolog, mitochondrial-like n=1 Tax=Lycium barbarum TaxID=112863 RepID=UPI00293F4908|nr:cytochrome c-type biogenesis protein CcmE homolog, mitochondrial-like [Lycium barbarum]XP_060216188.1 cytochrome c-type biogenesis protein CcmE homolog, mitochondrial-like [Lycium barbarum]